MKKGFTLVELSIVLVIVGLLIGGILVGQSLIESAKINRVIKEFAQYEIAAKQFKVKYKYLPGDHPQGYLFNSQCTQPLECRGDGDGKIYRQVYDGVRNYLEVRNVWYHLQGTGMLKINLPFTNVAVQTQTTWLTGDNFPKSAYGNNTMLILSTISAGNGISSIATASVLEHMGMQISNTGTDGSFYQGNIKPLNALALDQKIDDGVWGTGALLSHNTGGNVAGTLNCVTGASYNVSYDSDVNGCRVILVLDSLN